MKLLYLDNKEENLQHILIKVRGSEAPQKLDSKYHRNSPKEGKALLYTSPFCWEQVLMTPKHLSKSTLF